MLLCFISIQHKPNQPQQPCDKLSLWPKGLQPGADVPKLISKLKLKCSFRQIGFAAVWRGWRCCFVISAGFGPSADMPGGGQ